MTRLKIALIQMCSSRSIDENIAAAAHFITDAAGQGAQYIQTPEMTNLMVSKRADLFSQICLEQDDAGLKHLQDLAAKLKVWLHIGSMALLSILPNRAINRGFMISPEGQITARYDKIHMFDVDLDNGERYRESETYEPGSNAVLATLPWAKIGLGICYDVRFPQLFRAQAKAGASLITTPAAFTKTTGKAHWHPLLRARAIENGAYVASAAQGGEHEDGRQTFGHSLVIGPWGDIIAEKSDDAPGVLMADIDIDQVDKVRKKIASLRHDVNFILQ